MTDLSRNPGSEMTDLSRNPGRIVTLPSSRGLMYGVKTTAAYVMMGLGLLAGCRPDGSPEFDVIVSGGVVLDGLGGESIDADIGISGGRITVIGDLGGRSAGEVLDATGLVVAPGFIDIHSHATGSRPGSGGIFERPFAENYLRQGVTTAIGGQDGSSPTDVGAYLDSLEHVPIAINIGLFVGHGSLRGAIVGLDDRAATTAELQAMQDVVRRAMEDGAFGLSSGLEYTPGAFADINELIEVARPAATAGGLYISHIRDEGGLLLESVEEVIAVGRGADMKAQITHHKVIGKGRWGMSSQSLALVDAARAEGLDISSDVYPYTASSTGLTILFPDWAKEGGTARLQERLADELSRARIRAEVIDHINRERGADPSTIVAARCSWNPALDGKSLADILADRGRAVTVPAAAEVAIELVQAGSCSGVFHSMSEEDVRAIMRHPMTMISSDGGIPEPGSGVPHPRNYGAFARVLGRYVRADSVLTLSEAVRKMTSLPAERLDLENRGRLEVGMVADLVVFDPDTIIDTAEFGKPHQYAEGVRHVVVAGFPVVKDGTLTGLRPGRVLRHQ